MLSNDLSFCLEIDFDYLERFRWAHRTLIVAFHQKNENCVALRRQMCVLFWACFSIQSKRRFMRFSVACLKPLIHIVLRPRKDLSFWIEVDQGI